MAGRGQDGDRRDLGTGAGGGRYLDQRQAWPAREADTVNIGQGLRRAHQQGHQLGGVHRTAAAEADHAVNTGRAGGVDGRLNAGFRRIGENIREHRGGDADGRERGKRAIDQLGFDQARIGDQKQAGDAEALCDFAKAIGAALFADDLGRGFKGKLRHGDSLSDSVEVRMRLRRRARCDKPGPPVRRYACRRIPRG